MWSYNYSGSYELYHYGVKGMKWGVRRTPEQIGYNKQINTGTITASNGLIVRTSSIHAKTRAKDRMVDSEDAVDALKNPLHISDIKTDQYGRRSQRFIGSKATVNVNPDYGIITTLWKTGNHVRQKYLKERD